MFTDDPPRFTTFELDLALIGGQDKASARALPWPRFVEHWKGQLPALPARPGWDTKRRQLAWLEAFDAPEAWSTLTWPDFTRNLDPDVSIDRPTTLLHMALRDTVQGNPEAMEAFRFLLACGVKSNIWPGHGATAISKACLDGNLPAVAAMFEHGHDFQATLPPGADARAEFAGSCLLHRVGIHLARQAKAKPKPSVPAHRKSRAKAYAQEVAHRATSMLEFLVWHMPDPDAADAQGRSALEMTCQANPAIASRLKALFALRQSHHLAAQLGALPQNLPAEVAQQERSWAGKGVAVDGAGRPLLLVKDPTQSAGGAIALVPASAPAPGQGVVSLRALSVERVGEGLDGPDALALARDRKVDAVVCGRGASRVWWAFHPAQLRPAVLAPPPTPTAPPRHRL